MSNPATRHLHLNDGRRMSYSDTGTGKTGTWLHCHGIPGSRYELSELNPVYRSSGLRVIVPDRPGYGDSSPCPGYDFAQHSADFQQLADHLDLTSFAVSGFSGGGVFALVLAHDLGARAERLSVAATPAVPLMQDPFAHASQLTAGAWQAALADEHRLGVELQALTNSGDRLGEAILEALGAGEKRQLLVETRFPAFRLNLQTAAQQGAAESALALARDTRLTAGPWPFRLEGLTLPTRIVHGKQDQLVHIEHCHSLSESLRHAQILMMAGEGHYGVLKALFPADQTSPTG